MNIIIIDPLDMTPEGQRVIFSTAIGTPRGILVGKSDVKVDDSYHVEFTLDPSFKWGSNIVIVDDERMQLGFENNQLVLQGKIDTIWDDGSISIDLKEGG